MPACASFLSGLFSSLKFRITLVAVLGLALGIGAVTVLLTQRAERDLVSAQHRRELDDVVRTAAVLTRRSLELQRALRATAAGLDEATLADDHKLQAALVAMPALQELFAYVFITDASGRVRMTADGRGLHRPQASLGDRDFFQTAVSQARPIVSEPLPDRLLAAPAVMFVQPLVGPGGVHGVLGGSVRLASRELMSDLVDGSEMAGPRAALIVTDAGGRILAHPDPRRLLGQLRDEPALAQAHEAWHASGAPVEPIGLMLPQAGQVVTVAGVPGPDWVVWRVLPEDALLAPLREARRHALAWAGAALAVLAAAMLIIVSWLLHPLTLLRRRALRLFDPQDDAPRGWPRLGGEIGQLSRLLRRVSTERARIEKLNREMVVQLSSVMNASPVGIAVTRGNEVAELVSDELCRLFGKPRELLLGKSAQALFASEADWLRAHDEFTAAFRNGEAYLGEWEMRRADGSLFWAQVRGRLVDPNQISAGTIWTVSDISSEVAERQQLAWSASHDLLTGLANRRALLLRTERLLAERPASLPATLMVIDLDRFKPVNDLAGHAGGDAMLKAVAAALNSQVRQSDLVVRLGGDEFAVLLPNCKLDAAQRVAANVRQAIDGAGLHWGEHHLQVGASIGLAALDSDMPDTAAWLHAADLACYADKAMRRDDPPNRPTLRIVG